MKVVSRADIAAAPARQKGARSSAGARPREPVHLSGPGRNYGHASPFDVAQGVPSLSKDETAEAPR
jgi:hypothetical protein